MKNLTFNDINWNELRKQSLQKNPLNKKSAEDWDKRAPSFSKRISKSAYTEQFIKLLSPKQHWSVLDVGSGPGTLAIPLASKVQSITCLDYSSVMLDILKEKANELSISNITRCTCSWDANWQQSNILPHDVAIASRSLAIDNLYKGLEKLCKFATKKVAITDRVKYGPKDPHAFKAVGRKIMTGPDYIYTLNILYQMGFHASCTFIKLEEKSEYTDIEEAVSNYSWMFGEMTTQEKKKLKNYVQSITTNAENGRVHLHREYIPTWAFISWSPQERNI